MMVRIQPLLSTWRASAIPTKRKPKSQLFLPFDTAHTMTWAFRRDRTPYQSGLLRSRHRRALCPGIQFYLPLTEHLLGLQHERKRLDLP